MRRLIWLVVFPYVVTVSTGNNRGLCLDMEARTIKDCERLEIQGTPFECLNDCEYLYDLAEALNIGRRIRNDELVVIDSGVKMGPPKGETHSVTLDCK